MEWIKPGTKIDFLGKSRPWIIASALAVATSIVLFFAVGPNWGIDFAGGIELRVSFDQDPGMNNIREALKPIGMQDAQLIKFTGIKDKNVYTIQFKGEQRVDVKTAEESAVVGDRAKQTEDALKAAFPDSGVTLISADVVGDVVGADMKQKAIWAVTLALAGILIYVGLRFDFRFSSGAIVALFHDVIFTVGAFVLMRREFNLTFIAALLTIAGYSVNDTIVIFDRIRENRRKYHRESMVEVVNRSINETLSRTLLTNFTVGLAVLAMLFFGGELLRDFSLAMTIGVVVGTYSTVFIASPVFMALEKLTAARRRKRRAR